MPLHGSAMSLMLKKGFDRRKEDELWKAFNEADVNKDGYLSVEEYIQVFKNHGIAITQEEVMLFFNSKDRDRDGKISYEEFCDRETINERAFRAMDVNRDGYVSKAEMLSASNRSSRRLSAADVEACFREFDKDGDNKLNYNEFCDMMNTRRHSLDFEVGPSSHHHRSSSSPRKSPNRSSLKYPARKYLAADQDEEDKLSVSTTDTNVD